MTEDVKFSLDLVKAGYQLSFNHEASVWHNDDSYSQALDYCLKKEMLDGKVDYPSKQADEFLNLIGDLT